MSTTKLEDSEYNALLDLQRQWNALTAKFGELHYQKKIIETDLNTVDTNLDTIDQNRSDLLKKLQEKYGVGQINLATGEFISSTT